MRPEFGLKPEELLTKEPENRLIMGEKSWIYVLILTQHVQLNIVCSHIRAVLARFEKCWFANIRFFVAHLHRFQVQLRQWPVWVMLNGYPKMCGDLLLPNIGSTESIRLKYLSLNSAWIFSTFPSPEITAIRLVPLNHLIEWSSPHESTSIGHSSTMDLSWSIETVSSTFDK